MDSFKFKIQVFSVRALSSGYVFDPDVVGSDPN